MKSAVDLFNGYAFLFPIQQNMAAKAQHIIVLAGVKLQCA
jgi:hypothetical protein